MKPHVRKTVRKPPRRLRSLSFDVGDGRGGVRSDLDTVVGLSEEGIGVSSWRAWTVFSGSWPERSRRFCVSEAGSMIVEVEVEVKDELVVMLDVEFDVDVLVGVMVRGHRSAGVFISSHVYM